MALHSFLLTYSITHAEDTMKSTAAAKQVREKIARSDVTGWIKLDKVETAFKGVLNLRKVTIGEKQDEAQDAVKELMYGIMRDLNATSQVWAHCSLMVAGLGESMEFSF